MKKIITSLRQRYLQRKQFSSNDYWRQRYKLGRNSGPGSYGHLAEYKAAVLNAFVASNGINSIIEFGSGDGNQLTLAKYPAYTGYDVSLDAVARCRDMFAGDTHKKFFHTMDYEGQEADLTISLDVIFHLVEDDVFDEYMRRLFDASLRFVAIYSSNQDDPIEPVAPHVRHRHFSTWINKNAPHWKLRDHIPNPYPYNGDSSMTSFADFYFFERG